MLDEVPATPAAPTDEKGKGVERGEGVGGAGAENAEAAGSFDDTTEGHQATQQTPAAAASAFFSKWQSQLASNPNVKDLSRNISSLQSNLSTNLHQIQNQLTHLDLTEGQKVADRYLHKGEAWFQEFSAEVAHLAKEAVKVVPPTGGGVAGSTTTTGRSGFERAGTPVMTRRDMVMHKLRTDTSLLLIDPAQPPASSSSSSPQSTTDLSASTSAALMMNPDTREAYAAFLSFVQDRGGLDGDAFRADVERELLDGGEVLAQTRDQLVPAQIPEEIFWARYFFRKQCVEEEEERRKKVLQGEFLVLHQPPRYEITHTLLIAQPVCSRSARRRRLQLGHGRRGIGRFAPSPARARHVCARRPSCLVVVRGRLPDFRRNHSDPSLRCCCRCRSRHDDTTTAHRRRRRLGSASPRRLDRYLAYHFFREESARQQRRHELVRHCRRDERAPECGRAREAAAVGCYDDDDHGGGSGSGSGDWSRRCCCAAGGGRRRQRLGIKEMASCDFRCRHMRVDAGPHSSTSADGPRVYLVYPFDPFCLLPRVRTPRSGLSVSSLRSSCHTSTMFYLSFDSQRMLCIASVLRRRGIAHDVKE